MKIAVLKEQAEGEARVSATPETVKKFIKLGAKMAVEKGAGETASIPDEEYKEAGASIGSRAETLKDADIVFGVQGPDPKSIATMKKDAWLVAGLNPFGERGRVDAHGCAPERGDRHGQRQHSDAADAPVLENIQ